MKKFIMVSLITAIAVSLVACGGEKNNPSDSNNSSNTNIQSETQDSQITQTNSNLEIENEAKVTVPDGYEKYVNQGATILYPTDKYKESIMGGIEKIEGETPWVRLSILGDSFDKQKELCEQEHGNSSDYSLTEITVGEHKALKCIYSDSATYFMEVIIDTAFINDPYWASIAIKVDTPKSKSDISVFDDETLWEIINSFYFDKSMQYSF